MPEITPTPGRVVWFFPGSLDALHDFPSVKAGQPLAALVACVNDDDTINLAVFDPCGNPWGRQNVVLDQGREPIDPGMSRAEWMPYQKGQAAKTQALELANGDATQQAEQGNQTYGAEVRQVSAEQMDARLAEADRLRAVDRQDNLEQSKVGESLSPPDSTGTVLGGAPANGPGASAAPAADPTSAA